MKKIIHHTILTIIFLIISQIGFAQQPCGTYEYEKYLNTKFPGYTKALEQTREESLKEARKLNKADNDSVFYIPVVFHIVWNTKSQNIHDSLIHSQIAALNECFRHVHKDTSKVRSIFKPLVADARIEFYLATIDPTGKPTTGINRFKTEQTDFGQANGHAETVKSTFEYGVDAWNTEKYLNIWVCKFTVNGTLAVAAYATPPTNAKFWPSIFFSAAHLQGVVANYQYVGKQNPSDFSASNKERTLVHEVGHFFGLRHIWADKNNTCAGEDDGFSDTPLSRSASTICSTTKNTCNEGTGDKPDMTENYMDYTPYPCQVMFTQQQVQHMRYNLLNLRPQLANKSKNPASPHIYSKISVSPNPANGEGIRIIFDQQGDYKVNITDIIGQPVASLQFNVDYLLEHTCSISLAAGIYYITITDSNNLVTQQRILVQ